MRRAGLVAIAGLALGCGRAPEPDRSQAAATEAAAEPSADAPDPTSGAVEASRTQPPDAFALPGLREHAPVERLGWPVESVYITSSFGWRVDPVSGLGTRLHRGIDLRGTPGDLVLSIGAGRVEFVGHDPLLGNLVIIDHGRGLESYYGHLSDVLVVSDVPVARGAAIGLVGNTGRSAAPHLHLTIKLDGVAIDPLEILGEPQFRPKALATPLDALEPAALEPGAPQAVQGPGRGEGTTSGVSAGAPDGA